MLRIARSDDHPHFHGITKENLHIRSGAAIPIPRRQYEDALLACTRNRGGAV